MTIEEKAKAYAVERMVAYADDDMLSPRTIEVTHIHDECKQAYLAGAAEALRSQWKDAAKELPKEDEYVLIYGPRGIEAAWWNSHFQVWDDAEGDDYMYDKGKVTHWLPIPPLPDTEGQ